MIHLKKKKSQAESYKCNNGSLTEPRGSASSIALRMYSANMYTNNVTSDPRMTGRKLCLSRTTSYRILSQQSSGSNPSSVWRQRNPWTTVTEKELVGSPKSCNGCNVDPQHLHWAQQFGFVLCLPLRRVEPLEPNRLVEVSTGQHLREKSCVPSQSDSWVKQIPPQKWVTEQQGGKLYNSLRRRNGQKECCL